MSINRLTVMAGWNLEVTSLDNSNDEKFQGSDIREIYIIFRMIVLGQLILHNLLYGHP